MIVPHLFLSCSCCFQSSLRIIFLGELLLSLLLLGLPPPLLGEGCCLTGEAGLLRAADGAGGDGARFLAGGDEGFLIRGGDLEAKSCFGCGGGAAIAPSTLPCPALSMDGVTASPNLATGLGAVRFFSKSALRSLRVIMAGSTSGESSCCCRLPSNMDHFSARLRREAVSVMGSDWGGLGAGAGGRDGVANSALLVTWTVASVRQDGAETTSMSSSSWLSAAAAQVRAGLFGGGLGGSEAGTGREQGDRALCCCGLMNCMG